MPNLDSPRDVIYALADRWFSLKIMLEIDLGLNDLVLHIGTGLILQVVCAAALGLPLKSIYPWALVLTMQLINEAADLHFGGMIGEGGIGASALDTGLTMFLPTVLIIYSRMRTVAESNHMPPEKRCPKECRGVH